jgi:hypothetical protein
MRDVDVVTSRAMRVECVSTTLGMVLKCYWGQEHSLLYTARRDICGERIDPEVMDGNRDAKEGCASS